MEDLLEINESAVSTLMLQNTTTTRYVRRNAFQVIFLNSTVFDARQADKNLIKDMVIKLESFRKLEPGWDGYGAEVPAEASIVAARRFLMDNADTLLPFYFLAPGVNGDVLLELKKGERAAELYFNSDGSSELLLFNGEEIAAEGTLEQNSRELFDFFD